MGLVGNAFLVCFIFPAAVLVALVGVFSFYLPNYNTRLHSSYGGARVYRDEFGVPHVFAEDTTALFYAQGYLMAQDRLFQMEKFRRLAAGRLSELAGAATLDIDKTMRIIGLRQKALTVKNPPQIE